MSKKSKVTPESVLEMRKLLSDATLQSIKLLAESLEDQEAPLKLRIQVAEAIIDRSLGKAPQTVEVESKQESNFTFKVVESKTTE